MRELRAKDRVHFSGFEGKGEMSLVQTKRRKNTKKKSGKDPLSLLHRVLLRE